MKWDHAVIKKIIYPLLTSIIKTDHAKESPTIISASLRDDSVPKAEEVLITFIFTQSYSNTTDRL